MTQSLSRRQMLVGTGAAVAWQVLGTNRPARAASGQATILEIKVISRQPDLYHGWPAVMTYGYACN